MSDNVAVISRERAAKLSGLTLRQVDYWSGTDLVAPMTDRVLPNRRRVRLYGFMETMELLIVAQLISREHISLQHVRQVVQALRARGYETPLRELEFAVEGREIYVLIDGEWFADRRPHQPILPKVLDLEPLRARVHAAVARDGRASGQIERKRGVKSGRPVLGDTRIPVGTIRRYIEAGRTDAQIINSFPALTARDLHTVRTSDVA